jgi:hypothetical protein
MKTTEVININKKNNNCKTNSCNTYNLKSDINYNVYVDYLEKLKKHIVGLKGNPFDQIRFPDKYCRYLNGDFSLLPFEEKEDSIHFKYSAKKSVQ